MKMSGRRWRSARTRVSSFPSSIQLHHTHSCKVTRGGVYRVGLVGQDSKKRDVVQSMSSGRRAALGSIMSTLEQRRDQMFPKLRPEEIDRTATAAIERLFFVQKARL